MALRPSHLLDCLGDLWQDAELLEGGHGAHKFVFEDVEVFTKQRKGTIIKRMEAGMKPQEEGVEFWEYLRARLAYSK